MSTSMDTRAVRKQAESAANAIASEMEVVHGPYWRQRADLAKTILSLNAVIIAGVITFIDAHYVTAVLVASWAALALSLLSAVVVLWRTANLYKWHPRFVNAGPEIEKQISELEVESSTLAQDIGRIVKSAADVAMKPIEAGDLWAERLIKVAMVLLGTGIVLLIIFGASHLGGT